MPTPERDEKLRKVIQQRDPDLTIVLENIHDPHNISAVLRTADAVGVHEVNIVDTGINVPRKFGKKSSASAVKWVKVRRWDSAEDCITQLKRESYKLYSTLLVKEQQKNLYELELKGKVALVFGNEHEGLQSMWQEASDANFHHPDGGDDTQLEYFSSLCCITL